MGFSRDAIRAEANKEFKGLELDDVPGGTVTLRNALRLSDEERKRSTELGKAFEAIQENEEATMEELRTLLVDIAENLADRKEGFREYLSDFDVAELLAMYSLWAKETQSAESKSA